MMHIPKCLVSAFTTYTEHLQKINKKFRGENMAAKWLLGNSQGQHLQKRKDDISVSPSTSPRANTIPQINKTEKKPIDNRSLG
jgi:hypothetical protein